MDTQEVIAQAAQLRARVRQYAGLHGISGAAAAAKAQVCEFLRNYAGSRSAFLKQAEAARGSSTHIISVMDSIVMAFIEYLQAGLATGVSPERRAQLDVVSDLLA